MGVLVGEEWGGGGELGPMAAQVSKDTVGRGCGFKKNWNQRRVENMGIRWMKS